MVMKRPGPALGPDRPQGEQGDTRGLPTECLNDLLSGPPRAPMIGHVEMKDSSSVVRHNDEDEQHLKGHRRHGEEVNGHHASHVVGQHRL